MEGSKRRELSRGNRAEGSDQQRNPSERIREEGYEPKGGRIRAEVVCKIPLRARR